MACAVAPAAEATDEPAHRPAARYVRALLLARIYEVLPLLCPRCGGAMRIIAFITETAAIQAILGHLGEPKSRPRPMPALRANMTCDTEASMSFPAGSVLRS